MANFTQALTTLEFNKIIAQLAACAGTEGAAARAMRLTPTDDYERVEKLQTQTEDAKRLASVKGTPSFGFVKDVGASLERAEKDAVLTMRELLDIADVLRIARTLRDYNFTDKRFETALDEIFDRLEANPALEKRITRTIIAEDMIADEATPELAEIRRKKRSAADRIKETLQHYTSGAHSQYLQENIVTTRGGRYVIPVKSEHRGEIKGLIHDTSASGATLFIEPMAVVEANNALRELEIAEKHEIERILAELSALCAQNAAQISLNYYNITELAFIFARAELAFRMDAARPQLTKKMLLTLHRARHPLLNPKTVVPIDIQLGADFDTLVITGPNTGGKTVSLKTLGLFALMTQAGLQIPAADDSVMPVFSEVLADIGDEQSIEQSLSTFSAHMVTIVDILKSASDRSLVLFDELGSGTDPVEGAALAVSILEEIRSRHALCAATTHYAELKEFALDTEGVANASCEFDVETLRPTYHLIIGTPGRSNAFAISEKLGVPQSIVERARTHVSGRGQRFEEVIGKLEASRVEMEKERDEMERRRQEYEAFAARSEETIRARLEASEKEAEKNRAKAVQMLESARVSSEYVFSQLAEVKRKQDSAQLGEALEAARDNVRKSLRASDDVVNPVSERQRTEDYRLPRPLKKGDEVLLVNINKPGVLLDTPDADGKCTVQAGIIKTRTNVSNLMLLEEEKSSVVGKDRKKVSVSHYQAVVSRDFHSELDLRGQNGEDAWFMVDKYLDEAKVAHIQSVRLIHGKGTGALRSALWKFLKKDSRVKDFRLGQYGEGDSGVTVVELK